MADTDIRARPDGPGSQASPSAAVPASSPVGADPSRDEIDWGAQQPPPPEQLWSEILTEAQLLMLIAVNRRDATYVGDKRRKVTCERLRRARLVATVDGKLRLTDAGREALAEFAEEGEYEIDSDGFVVWITPAALTGSCSLALQGASDREVAPPGLDPAHLPHSACARNARDSDGSPKGGDAEGGSVHDSAGPQGIAQGEAA